MKTHEQLKSEALALIRQRGHAHEEELLEAMFPPPAFPNGGTDEQLRQWREARHDWTRLAFGGDGMEYRDSYASAASAATIALTKQGLIREHNNGYASYSFTPVL